MNLISEIKHRYNHIWLVGGAQLVQTFYREQQIDALQLSRVLLLLVGGIPLLTGEYDRQRLQLLDIEFYDTGIVEHHYEVIE